MAGFPFDCIRRNPSKISFAGGHAFCASPSRIDGIGERCTESTPWVIRGELKTLHMHCMMFGSLPDPLSHLSTPWARKAQTLRGELSFRSTEEQLPVSKTEIEAIRVFLSEKTLLIAFHGKSKHTAMDIVSRPNRSQRMLP